MDLLKEQLELESQSIEVSTKKFLDAKARDIKNNNFSSNKTTILIFKASVESLAKTLEEAISKTKSSKVSSIVIFRDFVENYYNNRYSDLAYQLISSILNLAHKNLLVTTYSNKLVSMLIESISIDNLDTIKSNEIDKLFRRFSPRVRAKKKLEYIKRVNKLLTIESTDKVKIGAFLVDVLLKSGLNLITLYKDNSKNMIRLSDEAVEILLKTEQFFIANCNTLEPLVIPPKDWKGLKGSGGYYSKGNISLVKSKNRKHQKLLEQYFTTNSHKLLDIINNLQKIPYKVNKRILDIVTYIIENNILSPRCSNNYPFLIGNIPYQDKLQIKLSMDDYDVYIDKDNAIVDNYKFAQYIRACNVQERREMKSLSKALQYRLSYLTAKKFSIYDDIYFTYSVDFRNRLYPIQQNFNPQAPENIKPLIMFSEGEILDEEGFYWLKVQGANTYGYDKLSFADRIHKIEEMNDEIIEIANDPIGTMMLWDRADEPLQFLTFCLSYKDACEGKPVHIPVYLDGTCSGIQHYSGLLKDRVGAIATNVISNGTDKPSDIYKEVANEVLEVIKEGAYSKEYNGNNGDILPTKHTAIEIYNNMSRSLTKRNVMTQPYSVTFMGMIKQNEAEMEAIVDANQKWWTGSNMVVSRLLAELNNEAIYRVVKGAKVGQQFLKDTISATVKDRDYVMWYTPFINFPVIQRIKKEKEVRYHSPFGHLKLYDETEETHKLKMSNGIAPNFIHSLDATHLYMTVSRCQDKGHNKFMLIHDSFGVPPNSVKVFNTEVREAFIQLYESNPLEKWYYDITNEQLPTNIMLNTLDLNEIRDSKYIFA